MPGRIIRLLDDEQWPTAGFGFELPIQPESAALGVIDVQRYCIDPKEHLARTVQLHSQELYQGYATRAASMVRNIQRLLDAFRNAPRRVFFTRHGAQISDGADLIVRRRGREELARADTEKEAGHMAVRGEDAYEIIPEVAPQPGELVFDKNTSSAFHTTPIDLFLRNMKIETLVLTGLAADQCVLATALDAADRGFHVIIVADACATFDPGSAEAVQILFGRVWGYVMQTDDVIAWLTTGEAPKRTRLPA